MLRLILIILAIVVLVKVCSAEAAENAFLEVPNREVKALKKHSTNAVESLVETIAETKINGTKIEDHLEEALDTAAVRMNQMTERAKVEAAVFVEDATNGAIKVGNKILDTMVTGTKSAINEATKSDE